MAVTVGPAPGIVFVPNNAGTFVAAVTTSLLLGAEGVSVSAIADGDGDVDLLTTDNQCVTVLTRRHQPVITSTRQLPRTFALGLTAPWNGDDHCLPLCRLRPLPLPHSLYVWGGMTSYRALPSTASATQAATTMITPQNPFCPVRL